MRNAKNVYNDVSENILDARLCQGMPVSCQSEVGSVRDRIVKNNILNGVIVCKEIPVESLKTTIEKKNFKIFNK